jgi:FtsZ-binding cell division protein ZapB
LKKNNRESEQMVLAGTEEGEILQRLSERVEKAVTTIAELRKERDALRAKLDAAETRVRTQDEESKRLGDLESDYEKFRTERSEIRNRIESILGSLETLDEGEEGESEQ